MLRGQREIKEEEPGGEEKMDLSVLIFQPTQQCYHISALNLQAISQGQTLLPLLKAKANVDVWKL